MADTYDQQDKRDQRDVLKSLIADIDKFILETRACRKDLGTIAKEAEELFAKGEITQLRYDIEQERVRRTAENINFCLRRLDRQKKMVLEKLREYESN